MKKIVLLCLCNMMAGLIMRGEGAVTPQGPLPEGVEEIYASENYTCKLKEAGPTLYKAISELGDSRTVNWVDISSRIRPYHLAQGFIDILLTVDMHEIEEVTLPKWYMLGDSDQENESDIRAFCNGVFYDLIDTDFKSVTGNVFTRDAKTEEYIILRFEVPQRIGDYYKIFIGKGAVGITATESSYTDSCRVKLYLAPPVSNVYACCDLLDVPITYENGEPLRQIFVNTPVTFDGSRSIDIAGGQIVQYAFDFDNNINPGVDVVDINPLVTHSYSTPGLRKVVLSVSSENGSSTSDGELSGVNSDNPNFNPLPLWVEVVGPSAEEKVVQLYQCAPHPFIPAQYPETQIKYMVPSSCRVTIKLYTFSGNLVRTLIDNEEKFPGEWVTTWDGTNEDREKVGSGIYFCQMEAGESRTIKNIVLIK